jgi:hypothetical protein
MTLKEQLTPEQSKAVFGAPMAAALYVSSASGGAFEMMKESVTASKMLAEQMQASGDSGFGEIVDDMLATMRGMSKDEMKAMTPMDESVKDMTALRLKAKQVVADAWAAVAALPGADGYARWLMEIAQATALTKTGGHFGIGNKSVVDEKEQAALDELKQVMTAG